MIKIVHIADVHFENSDHGQLPAFKNLLEESRAAAFEDAVSFAVSKRADLFVIAGDLFDGEKLTLKTVMQLNDSLRYLLDQGVRPVLAAGNHDPMDFYDKWDIQLPDECIVFGPEPERLVLSSRDGEKYTLNGCSHEKDGIIDNRGARYPVAAAKMVNIGVLHGTVEQWIDDEEPYMPVSVDALLEKQYHLWCLGHIHKRKEIREINGFYPGSLIGNKLGETGPKGLYYYELNRGHLSYEFVPMAKLIFEPLLINIEAEMDLSSLDELTALVLKKMDSIRKKAEIDTGIEGMLVVYHLKISGRSNLYYRLSDLVSLKHFEEHLETKIGAAKVFIDTSGLLPDVDMNLIAQSGSFPGFCMELLKRPEFIQTVLEGVDTLELAASTYFKSQSDEMAYRKRLIENIDRDVLRHLLREAEK